MSRPLPIWTLAGMEQPAYRDLPWAEKRTIIIRYQGLPVFEFNGPRLGECSTCKTKGEANTMECRFVPDCYPHGDLEGTGELTWWPALN